MAGGEHHLRGGLADIGYGRYRRAQWQEHEPNPRLMPGEVPVTAEFRRQRLDDIPVLQIDTGGVRSGNVQMAPVFPEDQYVEGRLYELIIRLMSPTARHSKRWADRWSGAAPQGSGSRLPPLQSAFS